MGIEDPDADVAEQQAPTGPEDAEELDDTGDLPLEADEADVAAQRTHVPEYEDDRSRS